MVYLSFEDDYENGYELLGVFETLEQAQSLEFADRIELWEGIELKQPWERRKGGWKTVSW